jgi:hypothetical protein
MQVHSLAAEFAAVHRMRLITFQQQFLLLAQAELDAASYAAVTAGRFEYGM